VEESLLHSVTALSGSGPAYFFYLVEALAEAGVGVGLSKEVAMELARHTAYGAGKMLLELADAASGPAELRRKVTSPGGTTEAALSVMEGKKWKKIVAQAVRAAASRSRELGK